MIGFLKGEIIDVSTETILLNVQGVGYELTCSGFNLEKWSSQMGKEISIWVYTHLREDLLQLFGFSNQDEKELFLSLLKVNGVGPKMAIHILSGATRGNLIEMLEKEDVKALSKLPKVGKKTAEQMILTLKGKLILNQEKKNLPADQNGISEGEPFVLSEISSALINLGFRSSEVDFVISQLPKNVSFEEGLRKGLAAFKGGY